MPDVPGTTQAASALDGDTVATSSSEMIPPDEAGALSDTPSEEIISGLTRRRSLVSAEDTSAL